MIDQLFAIVCYVSAGSTVPDWTVTGPAAEISDIEYRLEELMYDAVHDREALADGTARLRFKVPAETPYRTFALLFDEIERRQLSYTRPRPVPGFCPHGGAEGWSDRVEASENPNSPGPIVGVFGTDAQLARFRETPEWNYRPARLVDGRVGLTFSPTWAEIDNYGEYLSQVRAEFGAIDIVLMEPVDEAPPQGDQALRCDGVDFREELRQLALIRADWSRARVATFEFGGPVGAMSGLGRELERLGFAVQPNDVEPGLVAKISAAVDEDWARGMVTRLCNTAATHGASLRGWRTSTPEAGGTR